MPSAVIMAGGTGGHIFPALAVAKQLKQQGWDIIWLGTADRMEAELVPKHGFPIHFLPVKGLRAKGLIHKISALLGLVKSVFSAFKPIRQYKADVVIGFGGYPSFPGAVAAKLMGKPVIIHEQNAVAGLTNKLLGKVASQVFLGFPSAASAFNKKAEQLHIVGNPVREDIIEKHYFVNESQPVNESPTEAQSRPFRLLVIGGSLGAKVLNETLPECIQKLSADHTIDICHQSGKDNEHAVSAYYQNCAGNINVVSFIDDMAGAYQWADAVVCRAGALTVSEVAKAGIAACFVPLPHAVDDHQTKNAQYLEQKGAAVVVRQSELALKLPDLLSSWITQPSLCAEMGKVATECLPNNATEQLVATCTQYIKE